jgi:hypothetical protein
VSLATSTSGVVLHVAGFCAWNELFAAAWRRVCGPRLVLIRLSVRRRIRRESKSFSTTPDTLSRRLHATLLRAIDCDQASIVHMYVGQCGRTVWCCMTSPSSTKLFMFGFRPNPTSPRWLTTLRETTSLHETMRLNEAMGRQKRRLRCQCSSSRPRDAKARLRVVQIRVTMISVARSIESRCLFVPHVQDIKNVGPRLLALYFDGTVLHVRDWDSVWLRHAVLDVCALSDSNRRRENEFLRAPAIEKIYTDAGATTASTTMKSSFSTATWNIPHGCHTLYTILWVIKRTMTHDPLRQEIPLTCSVCGDRSFEAGYVSYRNFYVCNLHWPSLVTRDPNPPCHVVRKDTRIAQ